MRAEETIVPDSANQKVFQGYSGGMMLHMGYMLGTNPDAPTDAAGKSYSPQGGVVGIGGTLRVHLWRYLRVGSEGFVSTLNSGMSDQRKRLQPGSFTRMGFGGVNIDACWRKTKAWPYIGGAMGGGAIRSLYLVKGSTSDWLQEEETYFNKQSFFYVTPYVGCDYCVSPKMHITFRLDWMLALNKRHLIMPTGPRLYFGFMFTH